MGSSPEERAHNLKALAVGPLSSALAALSAASRGLPAGKDFHFYNSFPEFRRPVVSIADDSAQLLTSIASAPHGLPLPTPVPDPDESADWLAAAHDEIFDRVDTAIDRFQDARRAAGGSPGMDADGFQMVSGRKKKQGEGYKSSAKVASRPRAGGREFSFHIRELPKPQDVYGYIRNNDNRPFDHVWLKKSEDGLRFIHPMEECSVEDFVDRRISDPIKPLPIEITPFTLVEDMKALQKMVKKLKDAEELAVDLEHNQYRSFLGMTCLMQISTRTEDFVVDTLKIWPLIGPHLRGIFKDPSKRKIMHGARHDISWLQRDFGIYVCNMFDTGLASRELGLERYSLEFLLGHYCKVTTNKDYQKADWRRRPLTDDMIKYARVDTHYLLYVYDMMRNELLSPSPDVGDRLLEVYKRSSDTCIQLYEKDLFTSTSFLGVWGLQGMDLNAKQLAVVAGLYEWRDGVARAMDESRGYILPNKNLLEIAKNMPIFYGTLQPLMTFESPVFEERINDVIKVIRDSIGKAAAFVNVCEELKKARDEAMSASIQDDVDPVDIDNFPSSRTTKPKVVSMKSLEQSANPQVVSMKSLEQSANPAGPVIIAQPSKICSEPSMQPIEGEERTETNEYPSIKPTAVVSVQVQKKPRRAFGSMLGNSTSKKRQEQVGMDSKLELIKSSMPFPFHSFSGVTDASKSALGLDKEVSHPASPADDIPRRPDQTIPHETNTLSETQVGILAPSQSTISAEYIPLEAAFDEDAKLSEDSILDETREQQSVEPVRPYEASLAELSSLLQCSRTQNEAEAKEVEHDDLGTLTESSLAPPQNCGGDGDEAEGESAEGSKRLAPQNCGRDGDEDEGESAEGSKRGDKIYWPNFTDEGKDSAIPRRRQAFPPSGNRSMTFRQ